MTTSASRPKRARAASSSSNAARWTRRPAERPGELLDAALRVFAARGYRNASLEEVAAAAGVTKGAVYHYFKNKEDLLASALEHRQRRSAGRLEEALRQEPGTAAARIRLLFRRAFGDSDPSRRDMLALIQTVAHEAPAVYRRWVARGPMKWWRVVASLIAEGQASGEFGTEIDAEVAARVVLVGVLGQVSWQRYAETIPGVAIDQDRLIDAAVDMLLASLRPRRPAAVRGRRQ